MVGRSRLSRASHSDARRHGASHSFETARRHGTVAQTAERVGFEYALSQVRYASSVDLFLLGFLHFQEELERFGTEVIPIVRELEADLDRRGELLLTDAG